MRSPCGRRSVDHDGPVQRPRPRRRVLIPTLLATLALGALAGCGSVTTGQPTVSGAGATTAAPPQAAAVPTTPAVACPAQVSARKGAIDDTVVVNGENRTYRLWVPATYDGTTALPIVVNYHGTGGSPESIDAFSSTLSQKGNARGYLVVAPQALTGGSTAIRWTVPGFGTTPDDVAFTNAMLDKIAAEFCVDPKRQYATGFSSGGAMTTWIACSDSDRFAAVVPGGGVNLIDPSCQKAPIPMYAYHGTKDDTAFFNGIDDQPATPNPATAAIIPFFGSVELNMQAWAKGNGCQATFKDTQLAPDAVLRVWDGCTAPTQLLLAIGGGHTFPGGTTRLTGPDAEALGATITSVNMADLMLNWFDTQKKA